MNNIFILTPIDVKPEKEGTIVLATDEKQEKIGKLKLMNGSWILWSGEDIRHFTHYLRPLLPSKTAQEAAERFVEDKYGKGCRGTIVEGHKRSFLSGYSLAMAQGEQECVHPWSMVYTKCFGEINRCMKCGKDLGAY